MSTIPRERIFSRVRWQEEREWLRSLTCALCTDAQVKESDKAGNEWAATQRCNWYDLRAMAAQAGLFSFSLLTHTSPPSWLVGNACNTQTACYQHLRSHRIIRQVS